MAQELLKNNSFKITSSGSFRSSEKLNLEFQANYNYAKQTDVISTYMCALDAITDKLLTAATKAFMDSEKPYTPNEFLEAKQRMLTEFLRAFLDGAGMKYSDRLAYRFTRQNSTFLRLTDNDLAEIADKVTTSEKRRA